MASCYNNSGPIPLQQGSDNGWYTGETPSREMLRREEESGREVQGGAGGSRGDRDRVSAISAV